MQYQPNNIKTVIIVILTMRLYIVNLRKKIEDKHSFNVSVFNRYY